MQSGCWAVLAHKCHGSELPERWGAPPSSHTAASWTWNLESRRRWCLLRKSHNNPSHTVSLPPENGATWLNEKKLHRQILTLDYLNHQHTFGIQMISFSFERINDTLSFSVKKNSLPWWLKWEQIWQPTLYCLIFRRLLSCSLRKLCLSQKFTVFGQVPVFSQWHYKVLTFYNDGEGTSLVFFSMVFQALKFPKLHFFFENYFRMEDV